MSRKRKQRTKRRNHSSSGDKPAGSPETNEVSDELAYVDTLPEEVKLVEVNSNIWGTKFKIHGIAKNVPANLGQISYKTSLLHLQPRQMTVVVTELRDDFHNEPDPTFNPNIFSEDEEEAPLQNPTTIAQKRLNDMATPIAPMSPRPNRFLPRSRQNPSFRPLSKPNMLGPLAKAESYEDDFPYVEFSEAQQFHSNVTPRPKNIEAAATTSSSSSSGGGGRSGPSYTSLVTQYSRSSSNSSGQSRHAISPLCCEGSVPTLQSPKNAVAPSDIIFDRPPAGQTTVMTYSNSSDCSNTVVQMKNNALLTEQLRSAHVLSSHQTPTTSASLNHNHQQHDTKQATTKEKSPLPVVPAKKKDIRYIDEDNATASSSKDSPVEANFATIRRTPTVISISPSCLFESITRSCSVGYLDSVEMIPSDVALSILRREAPNKRLVLVDRKPNKKTKKFNDNQKKKLQQCGKSKSLDSCDLLQELMNQNNNSDKDKLMPKLNETSETEGSSTELPVENINSVKNNNSQSQATVKKTSERNICTACMHVPCECQVIQRQKTSASNAANNNVIESITVHSSAKGTSTPSKSKQNFETHFGESSRAGCSSTMTRAEKKSQKTKSHNKSEVITSYTDSPLFSRKHRFGEDSSSSRSPTHGKKYESSFSFLKQLAEVRRRKKDENKIEIEVQQQIDVAPAEPKASVSLHTQVCILLCLNFDSSS